MYEEHIKKKWNVFKVSTENNAILDELLDLVDRQHKLLFSVNTNDFQLRFHC